MKNTAKTLTLTAKKAPAKGSAQLAMPKTSTSYFVETEAAAKVTVVKTCSRLALLKTQAEPAPVESVKAGQSMREQAADSAAATAVLPAGRIAVVAPAAQSSMPAAPKAARQRAAVRRGEPATATVIATAGGTVSQTTDAAALAAIDTSGYLLPSVKVPGRRGRKPSEFMPENDEVAALNAVERAELKAASKALSARPRVI